ncbi:MAG TPA: peptidoglycan-binding domain-containing protein [Blastocatellia bacterium]|nr:peptidoglycan-binding domain-containing protein [Blastocatellia bacterium]
MRKHLSCFLALALLLALVGIDAEAAQKSRSGRKSAKARASKSAGKKASARVGRKGRGRGRRVARSRRGRRAKTYAQDSTPAPARSVSGIPTERVIEIQTALSKAGYFEGETTGEYNEETREAMKRFQAAKGLPDTGLPSAHTIKLLGIPKGSNDGYSVPIKKASEKTTDQQTP